MPPIKEEKEKKVVAYRTLSTAVLENAGLLLWLIKLYVTNKINFTAAQLLLTANGIKSNFIGFIEDVSKEAIAKDEDVRKDLMLLGFRALTVNVVVKPTSIVEAYKAPFRDQFRLVSALLDGYGSYSFIHKPTGFEEDKRVFQSALATGREDFSNKISQYLQIEMKNADVWETTSVFDVVRRVVFTALAETFLGIEEEDLLKVYEPLTKSLDFFEEMWQHPDKFKPFSMYEQYQTLECISNKLHEHRRAAELPDTFARNYKRPMNVTAIFLVASNLVHYINAAILHRCTSPLNPDLSTEQLNDLANEVATWLFRNSRIYRFDSGLFFSDAPKHMIGGQPSIPRTLTIIPQGDINDDRIRKDKHINANGRVSEPELFGRARRCPGSMISIAGAKAAFFAASVKKGVFIPNIAQYAAYNKFVEDRSDWENGRDSEEPVVKGHWVFEN